MTSSVSESDWPFTAVSLLRDLIAIPSVNPMGRELSGDEFLEMRLSDYLSASSKNWAFSMPVLKYFRADRM